jgi:hypothetical protein
MSISSKQEQSNWRRLALAGVVAGAMSLAATMANAAECPADKKVADGQGQKPSTAAAKDVTDVVRSTTDLSNEPAAINGRQFRLRQLDVKPGGIVPWHSHDNRPAMIYIVSAKLSSMPATAQCRSWRRKRRARRTGGRTPETPPRC